MRKQTGGFLSSQWSVRIGQGATKEKADRRRAAGQTEGAWGTRIRVVGLRPSPEYHTVDSQWVVIIPTSWVRIAAFKVADRSNTTRQHPPNPANLANLT